MKDRYIALLRGVNVGGKNGVSMKDLKECFEEIGFLNVKTYINSGNVLFDSSETDAEPLARMAEEAVERKCGVQTGVAVVSATMLRDAIENAPNWFGSDTASKHNVIFLINPANAEEISAQVGSNEYEQIFIVNNIIFWTAPLKTFSRTKWSKVSGTEIYKMITIRNINTAGKLADLAKREE